MDHNLLMKALKASQDGRRYAFATVVETTKKGTPQKPGARMIVLEDGTIFGTIGGGRNEKAAQKECLRAIKTGKATVVTYEYFGKIGQSVCGGQIKVFIDPALPQRHFIICGAGHIALPLSAIAKMLNYSVTIIDNRKAYANKRRFPHVDKILVGIHSQQLSKIPINAESHIMIVTQGNEYDFQCLKSVINSKAGYIGVISSLSKRVKFFARLKNMDITASALKKIHIPAGLDIGAQTPEEIAVAIAADLVALNNRARLGTDKFKAN